LPLEGVSAPCERTQAIAQRVRALEEALSAAQAEARTAQASLAESQASLTATRGALNRTQASLHEAERSLCDERSELSAVKEALYLEQSYAQRLAQELRIVTGSRLWRGAQLLRLLAGRTPHQAMVTRVTPPQAPAVTEAEAPLENEQVSRPTAPATEPEVAAVPSEIMTSIFRDIFVDNTWGSEISHSGTGSDLTQTAAIREELPQLLHDLNVQSMLDIPCGDFHWMQKLALDIDYTGGDVVPELIERNNERFGNERRRFMTVDIAAGELPRVDLVFCRDLLVHFSFVDALRAIENLKRSGSTYLLTTTFVDRTENSDIETGQWRPLNLRLPPFSLPPPLRVINERCTEGGGTDWADKSLGLWRLADL
jgi:hypothetical protein